jgi:hypothetical protein
VGGIAVPLFTGAIIVGANYIPVFFVTVLCGAVMAVTFRLSNKKRITRKNT